ncbi:MAG TPA: helix-turn-helix transcriptional regulator [Thermoanaerobaculia bacterium]|nr:helix-turn-helix transcriptional regulator [Thermoanaerobaculia bacterium]
MASPKTDWLTAAESYLAECRGRASSVRASEFALRMQRTPVQLAKEFRATVGRGVKEHLESLQIERAKELLRTTRSSTAEIALDAGFGTTRSFYRAFRRRTGVSPTEYRKEMSLAEVSFRH